FSETRAARCDPLIPHRIGISFSQRLPLSKKCHACLRANSLSPLDACPMLAYLRDNIAIGNTENHEENTPRSSGANHYYGTVSHKPPPRQRNADVRAREYLTDAEVDRLIKTAGNNRHGHRDATMILVAYGHGLRASELVALRWDAVDFSHGRLHVNRAKNGSSAVHPISGHELRALRRLKREQEPASPFLFTSEQGAPLTSA